MEILALLPILWVIFYLSDRADEKREKRTRSNDKRCCGDERIELRNMQDEKSEYRVLRAYYDKNRKEYYAIFWLSGIDETTILRAKTKEELENIVQDTYEELRGFV